MTDMTTRDMTTNLEWGRWYIKKDYEHHITDADWRMQNDISRC